jgi:hypothetical protein
VLFLKRRNCHGADRIEWANRGCSGQITEVLPALCQKEMHEELIPSSQTRSHQPLQYAIYLNSILTIPSFVGKVVAQSSTGGRRARLVLCALSFRVRRIALHREEMKNAKSLSMKGPRGHAGKNGCASVVLSGPDVGLCVDELPFSPVCLDSARESEL